MLYALRDLPVLLCPVHSSGVASSCSLTHIQTHAGPCTHGLSRLPQPSPCSCFSPSALLSFGIPFFFFHYASSLRCYGMPQVVHLDTGLRAFKNVSSTNLQAMSRGIHDICDSLQVVPVDTGLRAFKTVSSIGLQAKFRGFPGVGHGLTVEMLDEIRTFFTFCLPPPQLGKLSRSCQHVGNFDLISRRAYPQGTGLLKRCFTRFGLDFWLAATVMSKFQA